MPLTPPFPHCTGNSAVGQFLFLIDLSLEKGWYVSLQTPSLNDLKLDAELYKVLFG